MCCRSRSATHKLSRRRQKTAKAQSCLWQAKGKVQMGRTAVLLLETLRSLRIWVNPCGKLPHLTKNGRRSKDTRQTSCHSSSRVLSTRSSCSATPTCPTSLLQDHVKFYNASSTNTKWEGEWARTGRPVAGPGQKVNEPAQEDPFFGLPEWWQEFKEYCGWKVFQNTETHPRTLLVYLWGKRYQETQYSYLIPERPELRQTHRWSLSTSRKCWWLDNSRAQSLNWDFWISKQSLTCCHGTNFGNSKIREWKRSFWNLA